MPDASVTTKWILPDGVAIVGEVSGTLVNATVVLMHGGGQTRHSWSSLFRALAQEGYSVINYDARGHGDSAWSASRDYSFSRMGQDLRTILQGVAGPVAVVGASMGGISAMRAIADGLRPQALVLVDIVLFPDRNGINRIRTFMNSHHAGFATIEEVAEAVAEYNPNRPRPKDTSGLSRNLRRRADGRLYWHWDPHVLSDYVDDDIVAMAAVVEGLRAAPRIPTLLVRGQRSDVVTQESIDQFRMVLPELELFEVEQAGHMVAGDSNENFNRAVLEFLGRAFPPKAPARRAGD
jgi:pimeloyl-ACP methyl ester carboxylesterase